MIKSKLLFEIVFLDLDGTLLNDDKKVGAKDLECLQTLGELGVTRVFATGRTYYSCIEVLDDSIEFDYLVFSSGAGIYDWKNKKMLFESIIPKDRVVEISEKLIKMRMNFSVYFAIPENHNYQYYKSYDDIESDFNYKNSIHGDICYELESLEDLSDSTQFLAITTDIDDLKKMNHAFPDMKIIRASSPIDGKSIWLEIFNSNVSKAKGAKYLCNKLNISTEKTLSIGNDYNDLDLLDWSKVSYAVENSPNDIKSKYPTCCANNSNPLSDVIAQLGVLL